MERALSRLPDQLLSALRVAELDEPGVLFEYPRMTVEELKGSMGEMLGDHVAPSGAASSGQPTTSSLNSSTAATLTPRVACGMVVSESVGGDPRTDLFVPSGGEVKTDLFVPSGDEVKTGLFVPSGGEVKTDHFDRTGGDPKTDHIPFSVQMARVVDEMADSPRSGGLATQTAISATVSPALDPDVAVSSTLTLGSELRDELPSCQGDPEVRDEFPSFVQRSECRDGFPSIGDLQGQAHSEGSNGSTSDIENTAFSRISRVALRPCALAQVQVIRTSAGYFSTSRNIQGDYCGCSEG